MISRLIKLLRHPALQLLSFCILSGLAFTLLAHPAFAQSVTLDLGGGAGSGQGTVAGRVIQIVALTTILSLAPAILMMMTAFTRIIVVLSFLRSAMGVQQTPPNTVLVSLALFLTFFIMTPTLQAAWDNGVKPLMNNQIDETAAFTATVTPFKEFMMKHTLDADLKLFGDFAKVEKLDTAADVPLQVLVPAFMISELKRAFEIGFLLFIPFLIIDMAVSSILMAMGMMMLPPVMIALPFKIIFFVLVDGWHLIAGTLIRSYGG